ncbi:unnamed protein product [Heligmosomoides polygyrus]|uniref:legumain n=1 Tax=Heligmosomoides polygyrus TaxID=6339 RepID=A0A183FHI5_HELPZ|nr:unnamed protein product [Heligmosomoides polygyrus]
MKADVAHAYRTLKEHGVPADHIIVMMKDDIVNNAENPYPGKLFNEPNGPDLYEGLKIDYRGSAVTPQNFLGILKGQSHLVSGGNGRVLNTNEKDRIFVYFSDHGGVGIVNFPSHVLTVAELNAALEWMHSNKRYRQLVFYLEACESGSMFYKTLKQDINVYAITAANPDESSYATYCNAIAHLPCLGDEFSVNWLLDNDKRSTANWLLIDQYDFVQRRTVYSHVMRYGNLSIAIEPVGWFEGPQLSQRSVSGKKTVEKEGERWPSRDVEFMHLQKAQQMSPKSSAGAKMAKIIEDRKAIETVFSKIVNELIEDHQERDRVFRERSHIEDMSCHHDVVHVFDSLCVDVNKFDYALKYIYVLNNLCTKFKDSKKIISAMAATCVATRHQFFP